MFRDRRLVPHWFRWAVLLLLAAAASAEASPFLGLHPDAKEQPTPLGKSLHTLHLDGGQLYIGYGDYSANTGPISVRSYNLATGKFSAPRFSARTEAISQWRSINGQVFGVIADANFSPSQGGYVSGGQVEPWSETLVGPAVHSYDLAEHNGVLYLAGSGSPTASGHAGIYRTGDSGVTWTLDFEVSPSPGSYGRFYGIQPLGGRLYAFSTQVADNLSSLVVYRQQGRSWSKTPLSLDSAKASAMMDLVSLDGFLVGRHNHAGMALSRMYGFDGSRLSEVSPRSSGGETLFTYDHAVANGALYALTSDFRVMKTTDFRTWRNVVVGVTRNARSLAVADDCEIYLGGVNAGLYRYGAWTCLFRP